MEISQFLRLIKKDWRMENSWYYFAINKQKNKPIILLYALRLLRYWLTCPQKVAPVFKLRYGKTIIEIFTFN